MVKPLQPQFPFGIVVTLEPHFDGHQHTHGLFLADLEGAGEAVVGRAVDPGGLNEVLAAEQQAGGLRTANALTAAIGDQRGTLGQVDVGHGEDFGGGVDKDRDVALLGHVADHLGGKRAALGIGSSENVDHGGARTEGRVKFLDGAGFDDTRADRADGGIVDVARMARDDDFVLGKAGEIGQADVEVGVAAGDASGSGVRDGGGAAAGHHAELGLGEFSEARANAGHHLIDVYVMLSGLSHRRANLGQHGAAADDGEGAAGVDERLDSDGFVECRSQRESFRRSRLRAAGEEAT